MSTHIFLPLETEARIFLYLDIIFGFSMALHTLSLYLLIKKTPQNQITVRNYLIIIQVLLIIHDVHLDFNIHPIIVLQALGAYGTGWLLRIGVPLGTTFGIICLIWISLGVAIIMCIVHRHQTVVLPGNTFKFRKAVFEREKLDMETFQQTIFTVHVLLYTLLPIPIIIWTVTLHDQATCERIMLADPHEIAWIRDRGYFFFEQRRPILSIVIRMCVAILAGCSAFCLTVFFHMFYTLRKDASRRSLRSIHLISRSLINLFVQLVIPLSLLVIPTMLCAFAIIFPDFLSFEQNLVVYVFIPTHSIGHNIILLLVNSAYRKLFTSVFRRKAAPKIAVVASVT